MQVIPNTHLTYCTNIHPGKDWDSTWHELRKYVPQIKKEVSPQADFGLGLRLSNQASLELLHGKNLSLFKDWLQKENSYVFTLNGFPYGDFHNTPVKDKVHLPDWTTRERLVYTLRLFDILAKIIPEKMEGGISTSPISYKHWHATEEASSRAMDSACKNLAKVILHLKQIEDNSGIYLHLDLEPEPDGLLENSADITSFFKNFAFPQIGLTLKNKLGITENNAIELIKRYLNICYDVCHFALAYEAPETTFDTLDRLGIRVGKIQLSSALSARFADREAEEVWQSFAKFREPVYLHQVTQQIGNKIRTYRDLDQVLDEKPEATELRAHFHVPVFLDHFESLFTTQTQIKEVLKYCRETGVSNHLEIETYTWDVFPQAMKKSLKDTIVGEFRWVLGNLQFNE